MTNDIKAPQLAVEMRNITKTFGSVTANKGVSLELRKGEILALLGENGSGKTTLMNMLSGIYAQDSGEILVNGKQAVIRSPKDAFKLGIGMIHQHFKLVDVLSASENIILGLPGKGRMDRRAINKEIQDISAKYGFDINPAKKVYNMAVSEKQTVEIVKVLYRGANVLILDEPTAVLTPQETEKLFDVLRAMKRHGQSIIIITHKLHEVMEISDRVAILRKGEFIGVVNTCETNRQQLTEMMVGRAIQLEIERPQAAPGPVKLIVTHLTCVNHAGVTVLHDISFEARGGEILGIAGIAGSGQKELCEAIAGLQPVQGGAILFRNEKQGVVVDENIVGMRADKIFEKGISLAFVPEDRLGMGLVANMNMVDNVALRRYRLSPGIFVDRKGQRPICRHMIEELDIVTPGLSAPVRQLSGGNVQKVLLGREIMMLPEVLITAYPVRGLDINSSYRIYDMLNKEKTRGTAVIFVGEDLDVLMEISDRIMVMCAGRVTGMLDPRDTTKETIGLYMMQARESGEGESA